MPMPFYRNTNNSLIYVMLALIVICCLSIAGPRIIQPTLNNLTGYIALREFKIAFRDIQHPTGTEHISLRTKMGEFGGSQQGCDFFVGEVQNYNGSKDFILSAFSNQEVKGYPIQVLFLDGGNIPDLASVSMPEPLNDLAEWKLPSDVELNELYMVYLLVLDYEGDLKVDCD